MHRAPWPKASFYRAAALGVDPGILDEATKALASLRKAKSEAKVSMKTPIQGVTLVGVQARLDEVRLAMNDLLEAGRVTGDISFKPLTLEQIRSRVAEQARQAHLAEQRERVEKMVAKLQKKAHKIAENMKKRGKEFDLQGALADARAEAEKKIAQQEKAKQAAQAKAAKEATDSPADQADEIPIFAEDAEIDDADADTSNGNQNE